MQADLSKVDQINHLVRETINHFGKVDILVNNAGLEKHDDFWDVSEEDYDLVLNVNSRVLKARKPRQVRSLISKPSFSLLKP